jgi:hypothetical protein
MAQRVESSSDATCGNQHTGNGIEGALPDIYGVTQLAVEHFNAFFILMAI